MGRDRHHPDRGDRCGKRVVVTDTPAPEDAQRIGLDLVAPEVYAGALRRMVWIAVGFGVLVAVVVGVLLDLGTGLVAGLVIAVPVVIYALAVRRRRLWLRGTTIQARTLFGTRLLDTREVVGAEILVYPGRLSRISLRLTTNARRQVVPLAMYTDAGSGRELHILGIRRLADALTHTGSAAALAVADMLVHQLRAEARDAGLDERPLYRAVTVARSKQPMTPVVLSDSEVTTLY